MKNIRLVLIALLIAVSGILAGCGETEADPTDAPADIETPMVEDGDTGEDTEMDDMEEDGEDMEEDSDDADMDATEEMDDTEDGDEGEEDSED